jgi:hypothetical protein
VQQGFDPALQRAPGHLRMQRLQFCQAQACRVGKQGSVKVWLVGHGAVSARSGAILA